MNPDEYISALTWVYIMRLYIHQDRIRMTTSLNKCASQCIVFVWLCCLGVLCLKCPIKVLENITRVLLFSEPNKKIPKQCWILRILGIGIQNFKFGNSRFIFGTEASLEWAGIRRDRNWLVLSALGVMLRHWKRRKLRENGKFPRKMKKSWTIFCR